MENRLINKFGIKGRFQAILFGPDGVEKTRRDIKDLRVVPNTVTTFHDKLVADQLTDGGGTRPTHMAVGTGSGQGASDNSLATETDRNALTSTTQGTGASDNDVIYVADWAAGDGTGAITEAGIFNAASGHNMSFYADFSAINKAAGDTLQITWTVTYGAS